jgi:hypothetical protein
MRKTNVYYEPLTSIPLVTIQDLIYSNLAYGVPGYREGVTVASLKELWGKPEMVNLLAVRGSLILSSTKKITAFH